MIALIASPITTGCMVKINLLDNAGSSTQTTGTQGSGGLGAASGNALYYQNQNVSFSVALTDAATVSGTPRIPLSVGGVTRYANYASGSGTSTLTFVYQPQWGDFDSAGAVTTPTIDLNGGAIARISDSQDLAASAVITPPAAKILVDAVTHSISINQSSFSEAVTESAGARSLTLSLSPPSLGDLKIPLKRAGTAVAGADDDLIATEVTIPAGATSLNIPYLVIPSGADQSDRNLLVQLQRPSLAENFIVSTNDQYNLLIRDENPAATVASISTGYQFSCMILSGTGALKCWGNNRFGQIGDATTTHRSKPTLIDAGTSYSQVVNGFMHSCGMTAGGALKCWGKNTSGELGDNTAVDKSTPTAIDIGTSYVQISSRAGSSHTCGIVSGTKDLKCWGQNSKGNIGDGTTTDRRVPTTIDAGTPYVQVSVGGNFTCGIVSGYGDLKCWGDNYRGKLGDGTTTDRSTPTLIDGGTSYSKISTGAGHTCGIVTGTGALKCWGGNGLGTIGDGTTTDRSSPTLIDAGTSYAQIAAGSSHSCGIVSGTGALKCWGYNSNGLIGDGTYTDRLVPVVVDAGTSYVQVSVGYDHTCGITSANLLKCWGSNTFGQQGNGGSFTYYLPTQASPGFVPSQLSLASAATCALNGTGALYCWGKNDYGVLGDGTLLNREAPTCVDPTQSYSKVSARFYHACGITSGSGALKCWGYNLYGAIGDDSTINRMNPVLIDVGTSYSQVSAGEAHTCGIVGGTGALKCWGTNSYGRLGDGTVTQRKTPTLIDAGASYSQVVAGGYHTCGLLSGTGALKCWGYNNSGQLGDGSTTTRNTPTSIDAGTSYSQIVLGSQHTCAIVSGTGALKCWGSNSYGQLGDGTTTDRNVPTPIDVGTSYSRISAGTYSTCGVVSGTGALKCWGANTYAQLGDGTTTDRKSPTLIDAGTSYTDILIQESHTCGIVSGTGILKCWGANTYSQLGTMNQRTVTPSLIPLK